MYDMLRKVGLDVHSGLMVPAHEVMKDLLMLVCGFSCTSASGLNPDTAAARRCISGGADAKTGQTCAAVVGIARRFKPILIIL